MRALLRRLWKWLKASRCHKCGYPLTGQELPALTKSGAYPEGTEVCPACGRPCRQSSMD